MHVRARERRIGAGFICAVVASIVMSVLSWGTAVWASTKVGNAELQLWYRQRHTFQTDGREHFDWVQWRNEVFGWFIYDPLVHDGRLFDKIDLPLVQHAVLNARYRFRYDPVYDLRDHFKKIYDREERGSFAIPENGFRDLFVDLDFGQVGPGRLSTRIGNQQIIWGEADLFRSLDAFNPLHIDQTTGIGEKLDDLRAPELAFKFLYELGTVGTWLSEVGIESFFTPRYRTSHEKLLVEEGWRIPFHMRGCLGKSGSWCPIALRTVRTHAGSCLLGRSGCPGAALAVPGR